MATTVKPPVVKKIVKKRVSAMPSFRSGGLDEEIKRWEVASQTPEERKSRRTRRFHMLRTKPS